MHGKLANYLVQEFEYISCMLVKLPSIGVGITEGGHSFHKLNRNSQTEKCVNGQGIGVAVYSANLLISDV